jgi:PAS domain S-box-containing protein
MEVNPSEPEPAAGLKPLLTALQFDVLRRDEHFVLYRARAKGGSGTMLALAPASGVDASPAALSRLQHEYSLRSELDAAWAVRALDLVRVDGVPTLLLEDPRGESLDRLVGRPMDLTRFLRIGVGLSTALARLHARGMIHKDIRPANVVVDLDSGAVRLFGFGLASLAPRERPRAGGAAIAETSLAYIAPEQTGRIQRSVDSRTDLYSAGVVLYQMLTGVLPFEAQDPLAWIHAHVARKPVSPRERRPEIPLVLSDVVMKLLSKESDDRYQTAAGLQTDLERCLAQWRSSGRVDEFRVGLDDVPDRLLIAEKSYGREKEARALFDAFERVAATGRSEFVLVAGPAGAGKSTLVQGLQSAAVARNGFFLSGKFDQQQRDTPYATLVQAFHELMRRILSESEASVARWREAFLEALGANTRLIADLVPEMEIIVGKQQPPPELPGDAAQNRFDAVLQSFVAVVARPEHPLVLFVDDLQWVDPATLRFIERLAASREACHLLLAAAVRDDQLTPGHPLALGLESIRRAGGAVLELAVPPLTSDEVAAMLADALHRNAAEVAELAALVHEKTGGNPFFTIQFLQTLADERSLTFDPAARGWTWDVERIRAKGYTDNVGVLIIGKLRQLPSDARNAVGFLACLGHRAETALLAAASGMSEEDIHGALAPALREGLLSREADAYAFLHDRVEEAAYALIPEEQRAPIHLRIARRLLASGGEANLFDLMKQFDRGAALISDEEEKHVVAELNLRAARKAKAASAYASAATYCAAGIALLGPEGWSKRYALILALSLEHAEYSLLSGDFEGAETRIATILSRATSNVDKAAAYRLRITLEVVNSANAQAVATGIECLRLFGIELPRHPPWEQVDAEYRRVREALGDRPIESLMDLPALTNPEIEAAQRVLVDLYASAYLTDGAGLYALITCTIVNLTLLHGTSEPSAHAYAWFGWIIGRRFDKHEEGYRFGKLACALAESRGFVAQLGRIQYAMGLISSWLEPITISIEHYRKAFHTGVETGDLFWAGYSAAQLLGRRLIRGDPLDEVWRETEELLAFNRRTQYGLAIDLVLSDQRYIASVQRTKQTSSFLARFDEPAFEARLGPDRTSMMGCWYWILKLAACFTDGDHPAALTASRKAEALLWSSWGQIQLLDYNYFTALTMTAIGPPPPADREQWRTQLGAYQEQLQRWATRCPETFLDKAVLVSAEIARVEGRDLEAMRLYEDAIRAARASGSARHEAIANELAANFYLRHALVRAGRACLEQARDSYQRWGALAKAERLDAAIEGLRDGAPTTAGGERSLLDRLDLSSVVKAAQAISTELVPENLFETLMRIVIEHAGADRGLLLVGRGDAWHIRAEAIAADSSVDVRVFDAPATAADLPLSALQYTTQTRKPLFLDDERLAASHPADLLHLRSRPRSLLCIPLIKQETLAGVVYLENAAARDAFPPERVALLEVLASQAAVALDNASLYDGLRGENRERRKVEKELRVSEWRWRSLFETASAGVVLVGLDGRFVAANATFQAMVGHSEEELRNLTVLDITYEEDRANAQRLAASMVAGDMTQLTYDSRYRRKDGRILSAQVCTSVIPGEDGKPALFAGVLVDMTERKWADEALLRAREELARVTRVSTVGELTASIAHEINQPLAAVATYAGAALNWLERDTPNLGRARDALQRTIQESEHAGQIVSRVRALVKKAPPRTAEVDINQVILEVLDLSRNELQRNRVSIRTQLETGKPLVRGDRIQLQQVVLNLILNAIDAMSEPGTSPRELSITSRREKANEVLVEVHDSGRGLQAETIERMFDPFFTTKPEGMGMGLSISRSIVVAHGGRLWAVPNEPRGAVFRFTLPGVEPDTHPEA